MALMDKGSGNVRTVMMSICSKCDLVDADHNVPINGKLSKLLALAVHNEMTIRKPCKCGNMAYTMAVHFREN